MQQKMLVNYYFFPLLFFFFNTNWLQRVTLKSEFTFRSAPVYLVSPVVVFFSLKPVTEVRGAGNVQLHNVMWWTNCRWERRWLQYVRTGGAVLTLTCVLTYCRGGETGESTAAIVSAGNENKIFSINTDQAIRLVNKTYRMCPKQHDSTPYH